MAQQIQLRNGTAAEWTSKNPVLMVGEFGVETDTLKIKLGDGTSHWATLPYFTQGATGATGPANSLSIGTVTSGAVGSSASATITGTAPSQTLNLTLPTGATGATGPTGPANSLSVGTVTTGAAGSSASATITGTAPNQTLSLTIPKGDTGATGATGPTGATGATGQGVPSGGTTNQVLKKASNTSYDTTWANATGGVTASDTAPASPNPGDAWYDTVEGLLYVYYNDGNSSQWVEVKANSALNADLVSRVATVESKANAVPLSPNYLINGSFDIWQRGTSFSGGNQYTADRWYGAGSNITWSQETTTVLPNARFSLKATMTGAGQPLAYQAVETANAVGLAGQTVTLSAYLASNVSVAGYLLVEYSTATDNALTGTWTQLTGTVTANLSSSLTRYSSTVSIPSTAKSIRVLCAPNVALASGNTFTVAGVQLEQGGTVTAFRRNQNTIQAELAACQRYYETGSTKMFGNGLNGAGIATSTQFRVIKRIAPASVAVSSPPSGLTDASSGIIVEKITADTFFAFRASNEIAFSWSASAEL